MSGGVFAVARNIFEHEAFAQEPFTEREAWMWLIKEASWKDRKVRVGKAVVSLKRGQSAHSIRFMADAWRWHRAKAERFLKRLKTETMIETQTETGVTVVTICNYDEYQKVSLPAKTDGETATETEARQQRDRLEDRDKNIEDRKKVKSPSGPAAKPVFEKGPDAEAYRVGREVLGASAGGLVTKLKAYCDGDWLWVTDILRQAQAKDNPREWIGAVLKRYERPKTAKHILFPPAIYGRVANFG